VVTTSFAAHALPPDDRAELHALTGRMEATLAAATAAAEVVMPGPPPALSRDARDAFAMLERLSWLPQRMLAPALRAALPELAAAGLVEAKPIRGEDTPRVRLRAVRLREE
jgi:hypothetical protein